VIIIRHRRNTAGELQETSKQWGIEVDIRSYADELVIHHEPFVRGERFDQWLESYAHRFLILNVKEEGLEKPLLERMAKRGIEDFFFLDQSFPFLVKTAATGEKRCAVRVSEYESVETALALQGKVNWIWLDCFSRLPLNRRDADRLQEAGFNLCLVSPELQGRTAPEEIDQMRHQLSEEGISVAAVCTKKPEQWL